MSKLGSNIRQLREKQGLTQAQLGKSIGLAESTISLYESGKRAPDVDTIESLANFFGITTDHLLGRYEEPKLTSGADSDLASISQWPEGAKVLFRARKKLTPEQQRKMLRLIETYISEEEDEENE